MQQFIALVVVSVASLYLGRNFVRAWKSFLRAGDGDSACGGGCPGCGSSKASLSGKPVNSARRPDIIPLSDIRTLPNRTEKGSQGV